MKIIWTNGCFDILHLGHLKLLEYAKSLGDKLIVGIDSDERVKITKGKLRPINNQLDRKIFLESLKSVDKVVIFNTSNELKNYIKNFNIAVIVVGDDYKDKYVIGSEYTPVVFFSKLINRSTSDILEKICKQI